MSTLTQYYQKNQDENPYTMESFRDISRVTVLKEKIAEWIPKGAKILDVGCGDMFLAKEMPDYDWTGVDVNSQVNDGKAVKHDIEQFPYPFKSASFDAVVCSEVLEHLFDPVAVTKEIHRLLKPNGVYIVSTPNADFIEHYLTGFREIIFDVRKSWTKEHIHNYNLESHKQILASAGFKQFVYTGCDPHAGTFYQNGREVLHRFLQKELKLEDLAAIKLTDKLIGDMFKDYCHTILLVVKKGG